MKPLTALFAALLLLTLPAGAAHAQAQPHTENTMQLVINGQTFTVALANNATAQAFAKQLPLILKMDDLHGNEKYHYLATPLPARSENPGRIQTGDLMLFGDDCIVLFYKDFHTRYRYTRIGRLHNPAGLAAAVGGDAITAQFRPAQ